MANTISTLLSEAISGIQLTEQGTDIAVPTVAGRQRLYVKSDGIYLRLYSGAIQKIYTNTNLVIDASMIVSGVLNNARVNWASPSALGATAPAAITGTIVTAATRFAGPIIAPSADSTTALKVTKADGATAILTLDTTNRAMLLSGASNSITFTTLSGTSDPEIVLGRPGAYNVVLSGDTAMGQTLWVKNAIHASGSIWADLGGVGVGTAPGARGTVTLGAASGNPSYISWNEAGVANRGFMGFQAGSSTLFYRAGAFSVSSGNLALQIALSGLLTETVYDAVTSTVTNVAILDHSTTGTPATGYGSALSLRGQSSTTASRDMGRVRTEWATATDASRASRMVLSTFSGSTETDAVTILSDGKVGIGTTAPTSKLDVNDDRVRIRTQKTPTGTADSSGNTGDIAWDDNYFYAKTSAGWKRAALSTW